MTDEERQKLITNLENYQGYDRELNKLVHDAADEIKRLAADNNRLKQERDASDAEPDAPLPREHQDPSKWVSRETMERAHTAQSDAEPVAWQVKAKGSKNWYIWQREGLPSDNIDPEFYEARPLYAAPPRPDASAGLIEAAEMAEQCANGSFSKNEAMYLRGFADRLRARAADRSGK